MTEAHEALINELRAARKYRHLADETLARIASWALTNHSSTREAAKAAKRKLHQVFAAYCAQTDIDTLSARVARLPDSADSDAFRAACLGLLRGHTSTAKRIPFMADLYKALWQEVGRPRVLLDLACGFHPFALPWMGLGEDTTYHACDIDRRIVGAANNFLSRLGRQECVCCKDILVGMPEVVADVAFVFRTLPCLEEQAKGVGLQVLRSVPARQMVVSFPAESLGMRAAHDRRMAEIAAELGVPMRRLAFARETFYVLTKELVA